jgi:hypothetical protein
MPAPRGAASKVIQGQFGIAPGPFKKPETELVLTVLSPLLSTVASACVYAHGIRRQKQTIRQCQNPATAARLEEMRPLVLRNGHRLLAVEAAYLLFVLVLAATGLNDDPEGASFVTLILALTSGGVVALLAVTHLASDPSGSLVLPPLLLMVFGAVYPILQ